MRELRVELRIVACRELSYVLQGNELRVAVIYSYEC